MILEAVKTIKIRGFGIVSAGKIFDDSKKPIPKPILTEFKSGSGTITCHDASVPHPQQESVEPEEKSVEVSPEDSPSSEESESKETKPSKGSKRSPAKKAKTKSSTPKKRTLKKKE